jgi:hypothetical protein
VVRDWGVGRVPPKSICRNDFLEYCCCVLGRGEPASGLPDTRRRDARSAKDLSYMNSHEGDAALKAAALHSNLHPNASASDTQKQQQIPHPHPQTTRLGSLRELRAGGMTT